MRTPHAGFGLLILAVSSLVGSTLGRPQRTKAFPRTQQSTADPYPNTSDGLRILLNDLLQTAKSGDTAAIWSKIAELEIPNYENWFTDTFGPKNGPGMAATYGKSIKAGDTQFELLCEELAKQQGEVSTEKLDTAKNYSGLKGTLSEYRATWKKTDASPGPENQTIGSFFFADGNFRLNSAVRDVRILSPASGGPIVPAKLINKVNPVYPEAARQLRIQGTVAVNAIIGKDGTVTVQNVGAGHPLLAPPAVAAVRQWRYQPTTVNGEPVDVQVKLLVIFSLDKQGVPAK